MKCIYCHTILSKISDKTICSSCHCGVDYFIDDENILGFFIGTRINKSFYDILINLEINSIVFYKDKKKLFKLNNFIWIFPDNIQDIVNKLKNLIAFS